MFCHIKTLYALYCTLLCDKRMSNWRWHFQMTVLYYSVEGNDCNSFVKTLHNCFSLCKIFEEKKKKTHDVDIIKTKILPKLLECLPKI